jgi:hypothetical protein
MDYLRLWSSVMPDKRFESGRAMAQAVSGCHLIAKARVRARVSLCGIYCGQSGTEIGFSPSSSVLPCQCHSTVAIHVNISPGG